MARAPARKNTNPADRPLSPKQQALVNVILQAASDGIQLTREQEGIAAGYPPGEGARIQARNALTKPNVQKALTKGLNQLAKSDAARAYTAFRYLQMHAKSERVRADMVVKALELGGIGNGPQNTGGNGPAVVLNLHMSGASATLLTQPPIGLPNIVDSTATDEDDDRLAEAGDAWDEADDEADVTPPPLDDAQAPAATGGAKTAAEALAPTPPTNRSDLEVGEGVTEDGGGEVVVEAVDLVPKAAKGGAGRKKKRRLKLTPEARLRRYQQMAEINKLRWDRVRAAKAAEAAAAAGADGGGDE